MLQRVEGKLTFPEYKVIYTQRGERLEAYTNDKRWWEDFADKWGHTEIVEFAPTEFTEEQRERLSEVENIPESFADYAAEYALNNLFPDQLPDEKKMINHPFKELQLKKENEMLGQNQTSSDIKNLILEMDMANLGQQLTDVELKLLMKDMEG